VNTELARTLKEMVVIYSKVISRNLLVYSEDYYKNLNQNGGCSERGSTFSGTVSSVALANISE